MSTKREEERNEKIIRGLMKLPPNRRCINCNSVGPQYVCTNFWTFVCLTCSGIHREFTHRVKSVSMAKFTTQEVESLQQGGNQRAREIYLRNWDMQRMRLPDSSNPDRIRDFIRSVYVNKKYAGERSSEKPPRDVEGLKSSNETELRRPSSYHSYSQSPPYDNQYEERRYGKPASLGPRRLASDVGTHDGKFAGFMYSPGRLKEQQMMSEDRFANESSGSRFSDFSVSSAGDQFRYYEGQSPGSSSQDLVHASPPAPNQLSRYANAGPHRDSEGSHHRPQRTASSGSFGSFDSKSFDSGSLPSPHPHDQPPQLTTGPHQLVASQLPPTSKPAPVKPSPSFNQQKVQPTIDLFAGFNDQAVSGNKPEPVKVEPSDVPIDLFAGFNGPSLPAKAPVEVKPAVGPTTVDKNEGWANFDSPQSKQPTSELRVQVSAVVPTGDDVASGKGLLVSQVPVKSMANPGLVPQTVPQTVNQRITSIQDVQVPAKQETFQPWNAFGESNVSIPASSFGNVPVPPNDKTHIISQVASDMSVQFPVSVPPVSDLAKGTAPFMAQAPVKNITVLQPPVDQWNVGPLDVKQENFQTWNAFGQTGGNVQQLNLYGNLPINDKPQVQFPEHSVSTGPYTGHVDSKDSSLAPGIMMGGLPYNSSLQPIPGVMNYQAIKSTNPFDFPDEPDLGSGNAFMEMSSLQAALAVPAQQAPPAATDYFAGSGFVQQFYPQNPAAQYIPPIPQGGLPYMGGQAPNSQIQNLPPQGPYPSLGGNPFA